MIGLRGLECYFDLLRKLGRKKPMKNGDQTIKALPTIYSGLSICAADMTRTIERLKMVETVDEVKDVVLEMAQPRDYVACSAGLLRELYETDMCIKHERGE